jgi:Arc/MetJ family transcription regulator
MHMPRTTVNIDTEALDRARDALGTEGTSQTVNAALREVRRRKDLSGFDVLRDIEIGTPEEVAANRTSRVPHG